MSRSHRIAIFYEDRLTPGGEPKNYGPHLLLLACVADRLGCELADVRPVISALPQKGSNKLLHACQTEAPHYSRAIALFDEDHIREAIGVPASSSDPEVIKAIRERCPAAGLEIFLLEKNLETVVDAAGQCDSAIDLQEIRRKPCPAERDKIFQRLAWSAQSRPIRECILSKVPSLKELIERVAALAKE